MLLLDRKVRGSTVSLQDLYNATSQIIDALKAQVRQADRPLKVD